MTLPRYMDIPTTFPQVINKNLWKGQPKVFWGSIQNTQFNLIPELYHPALTPAWGMGDLWMAILILPFYLSVREISRVRTF
jgi:hypothetical protein